MNQLLASGGQSIEASASASASVLSMNIWGWFPLGLTGLILQSKGLSRVFSNVAVRDRDGEDMWTQGLFISMYDKIHYKNKKIKN